MTRRQALAIARDLRAAEHIVEFVGVGNVAPSEPSAVPGYTDFSGGKRRSTSSGHQA